MLQDCPVEALGVRSQGRGAKAWTGTPDRGCGRCQRCILWLGNFVQNRQKGVKVRLKTKGLRREPGPPHFCLISAVLNLIVMNADKVLVFVIIKYLYTYLNNIMQIYLYYLKRKLN